MGGRQLKRGIALLLMEEGFRPLTVRGAVHGRAVLNRRMGGAVRGWVGGTKLLGVCTFPPTPPPLIHLYPLHPDYCPPSPQASGASVNSCARA